MRDEEIKEGEWGEKYREFFKRFPNAATNIENGIYICENCGVIFSEINKGLYVAKNDNFFSEESDNIWCVSMSQLGKKYVSPRELNKEFCLIEKEEHYCPKCSSGVRKINDLSNVIPKCSKCGTEMYNDCFSL